eukprot:5694056-Pleurochrysis_carterae.AAC.1
MRGRSSGAQNKAALRGAAALAWNKAQGTARDDSIQRSLRGLDSTAERIVWPSSAQPPINPRRERRLR